MESETNGIGKAHKINRIIEYKRYRTPIRLKGKLSKGEVKILSKLIEQTTTHRYPCVEQLNNLNRLSDSADTVRTQTILRFCFEWREKNGCDRCPLFVSELGCTEYSGQDIQPNYITNNGKRYGQVALNDIWLRKSFNALVHKYREYLSWEKFKQLVQKIRERQEEEFGSFSVSSFGEEDET